ncbi:MAG: phospho-sugar mutase [Christensenellales bacterium]
MRNVEEKFKEWLSRSVDQEVNEQLQRMADDKQAMTNAFYKDLEFGTGGLRGELGAGTNCLNVYTIRKVTKGIADCMKVHGWTRAAVSCDSRINSALFARTVAEVFASCGIKTFLTKELMPTPFLSYITRATGSDVGVMITASHNPARYNGYKVYGADGCQLTDNGALEMIGYINKIDPFDVETDVAEKYIASGLIEYISDDIIESYLAEVYARRTALAEGIKITYTPLNGAGYKLVPEILKRMRVASLDIVPEQSMPDGRFTTCPYPNPEKAEALKLGLKRSDENGSDILIATDPDCDRVGIAVRTAEGMRLMSGNEVGVLLADYLLKRRSETGTLPYRPVIVKTIVTTELVRKVAAPYNAEIKDVLTGFKYIGDVIGKLEKKGEVDRYILGFEESYGYLSGAYVRDKDGVNASMLVAEMAAYYARLGKTLADRMEEIYAQYGLYEHRLMTYEFAGAEGSVRMAELLKGLRADLPKEIAGARVVKTVDYLTQTEADLPRSNVLSFSMDDGSQLVVRPSGTEPLIKVYLTACKDKRLNEEKFALMKAELDKRFV